MVERPNTLAGLIEKRRELSGQIEHYQRVLNELIIDLDHVDHTIRLFDPDLDVTLAQPKQFPPRHAAFRGEMQRFVLGALRAASEPITSLEIAIEVVKCRGLDPNDPARREPHTQARRLVYVPPQGQGTGARGGNDGAVQGMGDGAVGGTRVGKIGINHPLSTHLLTCFAGRIIRSGASSRRGLNSKAQLCQTMSRPSRTR